MIADVEVPPDPPPLAKLAILVVSVHDEPFQVSTFVEFGLFDVTIAAVVVPVRGLSVPVEFVLPVSVHDEPFQVSEFCESVG